MRKNSIRSELVIFTKVRALVLCALLIAMSVSLAWVGKAYFTYFVFIRITFENLPIMFAALTFGPLAGAVVAGVSDLFSCLLAGNPVNPVITAGAVSIGLLCGFISKYLIKKTGCLRIIVSCAAAHIVGSMIIKSLGLMIYFANPLVLLWRIPLYIGIGTVEIICLCILMRNKEINSLTGRIKSL